MLNRLLIPLFALSLGACATTSPCEDYVAALCDCAETDEECDEYEKTYEDPTPDDDEECSAGLDKAEENAEDCEEEDGSSS